MNRSPLTMPVTVTCARAHCGELVTIYRRTSVKEQNYCSDACRQAAWRERAGRRVGDKQPLRERMCEHCPNLFMPSPRNITTQRFCSAKCRVAHHRAIAQGLVYC